MTPTRPPAIAAALLLLLPASPALALDATRPEVDAFIEEMVRNNGLDGGWLRELLRAAETRPRIIELMTRPAERTKPWHEYRDHFLTEERIAAGLAFWSAHRDRLAEVEARTGVAAQVIVGILGVETFYGRITGGFRVLDALATLAFDYPPRSDYFRGELEQFLLLSREEAVEPLGAKGSYAGAMGYPQFMPRSYRAYAVDGDGDGRRDLWGSWDDVIASVANYLLQHGWRAGEPVLAPAGLPFPDDSTGLVAGSLRADETVGSLRTKGLVFDSPLAEDAPALFIEVAGRDGPERLAGFGNFSVITRYNRSVLYALAVNELGEAVRARLPPVASP
jgi:membrane-bound lytic murein transglycosylase B